MNELGQYRNHPVTEFNVVSVGHRNHLPYANQITEEEFGFAREAPYVETPGGPYTPSSPVHLPVFGHAGCSSCSGEQVEEEI